MQNQDLTNILLWSKQTLYYLFYSHITGIVFQLEPSVFELLSRLEKKMSHIIKSVGNIDHEVYPL